MFSSAIILLSTIAELQFDFESLRKLASEGNSTAQFELGTLFHSGLHGIERNEPKGLLYDYFAAIGGDQAALMSMGHRHDRGIGVPISCNTAVAYYQKVAKAVVDGWQGNPVVERRPDFLFADSEPNKKIDETVVQYYAAEAEQQMQRSPGGGAKLLADLGRLYYFGTTHLQRNFEKAASFFKKAAALGETSALSGLGYLYMRGFGVEQDYVAALEYFEKGSDQGDASAKNGLGLMYFEAKGVKRDKAKAGKLFQSAMGEGHSDAFYNMGRLQRTRGESLGAFHNFEQAMRQGHVKAIYELGNMHLKGESTVSSCSSALTLFKAAAARGEAGEGATWKALKNYEKGDMEGALFSFTAASRAGYQVAQLNAAWMYEHGLGVTVDLPAEMQPHTLGSRLLSRLVGGSAAGADVTPTPTAPGTPASASPSSLQQQQYEADDENENEYYNNFWTVAGFMLSSSLSRNSRKFDFGGELGRWMGSSSSGNAGNHVTLQEAHARAFSFYKDAAIGMANTRHHSRGETYAHVKLGDYYYYGLGRTSQSYKRAASEYRKSSSARARFNLAYMYEHGLGVRKNSLEAEHMYKSSLAPEKGTWLPAHIAIFKLQAFKWLDDNFWGTPVGVTVLQKYEALRARVMRTEWVRRFLPLVYGDKAGSSSGTGGGSGGSSSGSSAGAGAGAATAATGGDSDAGLSSFSSLWEPAQVVSVTLR